VRRDASAAEGQSAAGERSASELDACGETSKTSALKAQL
jgi:hypothetical protein